MVWKFVVFGFQLDIYEDFISAKHLIRKKKQSNTMMEISKYLVGKTIKVYLLEWNLVFNWNIVAF